MNRIRPYIGDIVFGLVAGVTAAELGLDALRGVPLWLVCVLGVASVVMAELVVAAIRHRRTTDRPRRRAHARPAASSPLAASAKQTEGDT